MDKKTKPDSLILPESLLGAADHIAQQYCRWANGILITKGAKQLTLLYLSQFSKWCCQYALTTKPSMQFLFIWSYWLLCILYHQIYSCWLTIVHSHQSQILIWRCPNPIIHIDPASINSGFKTFDDSVQLSVGENVLNNQHKLHSCVSAPQKKKKWNPSTELDEIWRCRTTEWDFNTKQCWPHFLSLKLCSCFCAVLVCAGLWNTAGLEGKSNKMIK